jgi:hypothetical protein
MRKFKVGDRFTHHEEGKIFEIVCIVEDPIVYVGDWVMGVDKSHVSQCYVAKLVETDPGCALAAAIGKLFKLTFESEYKADFVESKSISAKSSDWNTVCQRCGAPAYQGLFKVECSKDCK